MTTKANLLKAADLLNQAVAHDPTFFQAYCQLAWVHDQLYHFRFDRTPARLALAEAAIKAAFRLRPDAGEAHLARAENLYRGYLDYDGALAELEIARQTLPNELGYSSSRVTLSVAAQVVIRKRHYAISSAQSISTRATFSCYSRSSSVMTIFGAMRRKKPAVDRALAIEPNDVETKVCARDGGIRLESRYPALASIDR